MNLDKQIKHLKINQSIRLVDKGWLYEICHFWNHPWASRGYVKITSPHIDEGSYETYAMTPMLALVAVRKKICD